MMKRRVVGLCALGCAVWLAGCSGDDEDDDSSPSPVAGDDDTNVASPTPDLTPTISPSPEPLPEERGEYLVRHVVPCGDCHTPRDEYGQPIEAQFLAGVASFADIVPDDDTLGNIPAPNLTPDATGLADWTGEEIKNAMLNGWEKDGSALFSVMPYYEFHNMSSQDADAIVAFLQSIAAVNNDVGDRQDLGFPYDTPASPVPESDIPHTTLASDDPDYETAERGRYLAGLTGACVGCHTPEATEGSVPLDTSKMFSGGREFSSASFGLPVPPYSETIYTRNITPHTNGIFGWTPEQVMKALLEGTDIDGDYLCPPMPSGPEGPYGGMTAEDALAIGVYLTTIPAVESEDYPECSIAAE